ncbi:MAG TPA: pitrilysin family protein [Bryobacteraceae bacterium]|nr:pitrilysin family protein [Bryobacteraceae bacterium]
MSIRTGAALLAFALTSMAQDITVDIPYQKFVLNNGLTLIVHEDHKSPIVAVNVWYHVGSKNEKAGKTGFAHLFEHLMFGGSANMKMRYIDAMERVGATNLNGTTNNDRTNYFETVPTSALDYVLFAESDRMGHLLGSFDKKTLDLQRGVVQNEKRQGENQPYGITEQLITDATYPASHPYSWTVIGSMDDLNAASMDDVETWFKTYYGPSNAVIVLAGDIDAATAKAKVEKYFGDIPPGPPVAHYEAWTAKMTGTHRERVQDRVPQARLYKVWNVPAYGSADNDYLDLVSDCLSHGKTSRLYKRLVYDDQIATEVQAFVDSREIGSQFQIVMTARPGQDLNKIETEIDEELARFLKEGPSAQELERVKIERVAGFVRGLERVGGFGGKSDTLAIGQVYLGDPSAYKTTLNRVNNATAEDVRGAAQRWLSDGQFVLEVHPFPEYEAAKTGVDRSKAPETAAAPVSKFPKLERASLSNGLKVILAERHELPLINCWMLLDGGYSADQFGKPGTAKLAMNTLTSGTKTRSALEISDELRSLGAQLNASSNLDLSIVRLSALKSKLDDALNIYADVILNPTFPEADFKRQQQQSLDRIEQEKVQPVGIALRVFPALIYGKGHAYGNPFTGSGTTDSVRQITREELVKFHGTWFHSNAATLVIAGDTTMGEILPKLERQFGAWKKGETPTKNLSTVRLAPKPIVYLVDRPGALQSVIIATHIAPPKNNPQEIAITLLNDMIGGTFGSRLNMNLREDKHWSYGAFSTVIPAKGQSPFLALAPVQTDKTKESLEEMNRELRGFVGSKPVSDEELAKEKINQVLALTGSHETLDSVGGAIEQVVEFGFPDNYWSTYGSKIEAARTADVNDAAKSILHPDSLMWVVVGDRAKIEQGVREANIGEIRLIDADGNRL